MFVIVQFPGCDGFRRSVWLERPYAILATAAVAADSEAEAERLAATLDFNVVRRAQGEYRPLVSPEQALAYPYSAAEERVRQAGRKRLFVGTPAGLRERLGGFAGAVEADELMITSAIFDHAARRRSYELLAAAFALPGAAGG